MKHCGIDEAGRGPVIGPLVMCGVVLDEKEEDALATLGIKDSKLLTPARREELFEIVAAKLRHEVRIIEPHEVDDAIRSLPGGLNRLEAKATIWLIDHLSADTYIVDCPSTNVTSYGSFLLESTGIRKSQLICEHKADEHYLACSCASIIAKVTRDRIIEDLHKKYGDFGSGYPSDPKTIVFLKQNIKKCGPICRTSWKTYQAIAATMKQSFLDSFEKK